jgi:tetratricopeptide (TPR) repeat protein
MSLRTKSIEELLDLEEELHSSRDDEQDGSLDRLISLYDELYKRISSDRNSEYAQSLAQIKKNLISYLVRYGTYLKTVFQKDDNAASSALTKALRYDGRNPIAHYRLGFLSYKQRDYSVALQNFQKSISYQKSYSNLEYQLNNQQLYNAHLYLTNSALYIAKEAQRSLERLPVVPNQAGVSNLAMSPFYEVIQRNEGYLQSQAFTIVSQDGKRTCSKDECERITESESALPNTLILYFSDRANYILFNGEEKSLSLNQAEMLRYFLLSSNEAVPVTRDKFFDLFQNARELDAVPLNTFVVNVRRLRGKLSDLRVPAIIVNKLWERETAYYFNRQLPFAIIHRSDDTFILE